MKTTDARQHVNCLIDQLPPTQLAVIEELLCVIIDPVAHALRNAPIEDEEIGEEIGAGRLTRQRMVQA